MATLTLTACANAAAQYLGVLDSGEALSTPQLTDALAYTTSMVDNWSVDDPMLLSGSIVAQSFVASQQKYTIGTGQNFNMTRPVEIVSAALILPNGPGMPIDVLTAKSWTQIPDRQSTSWSVRNLFYDRGFPTGNVYFSPVPLGGSVELTVFSALPPFADATTPLTMPGPGYSDLYIFGTALRMAAQMSVPIPESVQASWLSSAERVRMQNAKLWGVVLPELAAAEAK